MATVLSVNVGMPKDVPWQGKTVHTGIWKRPVAGPQMVRRLNIDGDGQGDLAGHGGEQRAVLVYQAESIRYWQEFLGRDSLEYGAFGENFTIDGLSDDEACIGDRYRIGEAEFEVTQPRVTCYRVGMRLDAPQMPAWLVEHHRPGFYLRVITEGRVQAGDEIVRTRRGPHELSVADIDALLYLPDRDRDKLKDAVEIPALSPGWRQSFLDLLKDDGAAAPSVGGEPGRPGWPGRPGRSGRPGRPGRSSRSDRPAWSTRDLAEREVAEQKRVIGDLARDNGVVSQLPRPDAVRWKDDCGIPDAAQGDHEREGRDHGRG